jgi:hypothetical protein
MHKAAGSRRSCVPAGAIGRRARLWRRVSLGDPGYTAAEFVGDPGCRRHFVHALPL